MCGIVGYVGDREAQPILVNCLRRLEYRGYDSCGIALRNADSVKLSKDAVRIETLAGTLLPNSSGIGIGHTRWATHGKPSQVNAHPHTDCTGKIAVVHNGVIDNYLQLRESLIEEGHRFVSETDTEVIPHLVEKHYQGDLEQAVYKALEEIEGYYAFIVFHSDSEELVVARNGSPLIVGVSDREKFVASDVPAVLDYTDRVIYVEDGDVGVITQGNMRFTRNGEVVEKEEQGIPWSLEEAQKAGYDHFMLKEIHEQPKVIRNTLSGHVSAVEPSVNLGIDLSARFDRILLLACGTSYHAALVGKHLMERLARVPVHVEIASEFNYSGEVFGETLAILITQSGETTDSIRALKKAKASGCRTLAVTNVIGSSITRIADQSLYIKAGPEISVAATKSFVAQLVMLYLLALDLAVADVRSRGNMIGELRQLPNKVRELLEGEEEIAEQGEYLASFDNVFIVARGINYPVALEGALKVKEISYVHAEGYAAGELKHGPFALLTPSTPVVAVVARDNTYDTLMANIKEIKARESPVLAIAPEGDSEVGKYVDSVIRVPSVDPLFSPVVNTVALQLLAYYAAKARGCPIDTPRNLAKSVTVE